MSAKSSQKTIKIDSKLWDELDTWLKMDDAQEMGYHSKAQFTTEAVRLLLDKYRLRDIRLSDEALAQLTKDYQHEIKKGQIKKKVSFEEYVYKRIEMGIRSDKRTEHRT